MENFDGDGAAVADVLGQIDCSHTATPELALDGIAVTQGICQRDGRCSQVCTTGRRYVESERPGNIAPASERSPARRRGLAPRLLTPRRAPRCSSLASPARGTPRPRPRVDRTSR